MPDRRSRSRRPLVAGVALDLFLAATVAVLGAPAGGLTAAVGQPPSPEPSPTGMAGSDLGAGLTEPFQRPDPVSGRTLNATDFGASPGDAADDDSQALQRAIDAAAPGDEVLVPAGVLHLKTRKLRLKTGVSLRGASRDGSVLAAQLDAVSKNPGSMLLVAAPGVGNLTISDLTITQTGGQQLNYAIWLGEGAADTALVSRIAVERVTVGGFLKMGISIRNGQHIRVADNAVIEPAGLGGGGQGYGVMVGYDNSQNNWVVGNTLGPGLRHAVVLQFRAHHTLVENNLATACEQDCDDLHGEDEHHNELRGNTAEGAGEGGFGVGNTGGKPEHFNAGPGNWIHDNVATGARFGIHIYRESNDQVVERNTFRGNDLGMTIRNEGAQRVRFVGNVVEGNADGVRLENAAEVVMTGNKVTGNEGFALKADKGTTGYTITGNDFSGNGDGVELASPDGVYQDNVEGPGGTGAAAP